MTAAAAHARANTHAGFGCGPLEIVLQTESDALRRKVLETLDLYTVAWPVRCASIVIEAVFVADHAAHDCRGSFLECGRMLVDGEGCDLVASCRSGARCRSFDRGSFWRIEVPRHTLTGETVPEDIEDLVGLVLTTGWRQLGLVPMHLGSVVRNGACILLCAPSGGGKTTLTSALIREGWQTLGDDKVLLDLDPSGTPRARALIDRFNLHPASKRWFSEIGDLTVLPRYSAWTEKRKVAIETIWPGAVLRESRPTHLLRLAPRPDSPGIRLAPLGQQDLVATLLRQTVIPNDRATARGILPTILSAARQMTGHELTVGRDSFHQPGWSAPLEDLVA